MQFEVIINSHTVRIIQQNDGTYKPWHVDLSVSASLDFLSQTDHLKAFYQYLAGGQFEQLRKFTSYHADVIREISEQRILHFLLANISCSIFFSESPLEIEQKIQMWIPFISGMCQRKFTPKDILELINNEGFDVHFGGNGIA